MGTISYTIPSAGSTLNSIADPELSTALQTLLTWANGNVDTNNISPTAGITNGQLAPGAGRLSLVTKTATYAANVGELVLAGVTGAPFTVTLPIPSANVLVGIVAGASATGANPITVARHATDVIQGVGLSSATSFTLGTPGAFAVLQSDGTNWFVVSGQRDTGWVSLGLLGSTGTLNFDVPGARLQGDTVRLRGAMNSSGTIGAGANWANLPAAMAPTNIKWIPAWLNGVGLLQIATGATGIQHSNSATGGNNFFLDGITFTL